MSDEKRFFEEITPKAIAENGVVSLAIRPNQKSQYGTGGLSGKELQQRFDKLATLIISYYNEVAKALSSKDVLEYFKMPDETTLADFIAKITDDNYDIVSANPYEQGKEGKLSAIIQKFYTNIESLAAFTQLSNYEEGKTLSDIFAKTTALIEAIEKHNKATDNHTDIRRDLDTVKAFLSSDDGTEAIDRLHELIALIRANAGTIDEIGKNKVNKDDIIRSYQALAGAGQDSVAGAKLLYDLFATKEDLKPFLSVEALTSALEPYAKDLRLGNTLKYLITNYQHAQTDIDGWIGKEDTWVVSADQPINGIKNGDPLLFRCFNTTLNQYSYVFAKAVEDYASNNRIRALSTSVIHSGASTSGGIDKESIVTNLDDTSTDKVLAASVGALIKERIENAVKGLVSDKSLTEAIKGFVTEAVLDEAITSAVTDLVKRTDFDKTLANYALTTEVHNIVKDKITAADVGARPDTWTPSADEVGARPASWMPTATEVGAHPNTWIPTAEQVGARPDTWTPSASDVGARPNTWTPTYAEVGADKEGTASAAVSGHNTNSEAHNDIRLELKALADRIAAVLDSDDTTLDELSEIVAYIKSNKSLIDSITTSKVNVADIINNLTSNVTNKPLSAAQGVALKGLYDALQQTVTALGNSKLDSSALTNAINTALAQAKTSGEFDGKDGENGTSVTVKSVSESSADGGSNVVTFSDGKTVTIKNGNKGDDGENGVGISSIERTATNGREDTYTITLTNGVTRTFIVTNGKDGEIGTPGENGKTPVKGVDYFTEGDISDMVTAVMNAIGTPLFGVIDENNHITFSGKNIPDGTYTWDYKMENGSKVPGGTFVLDTNVYYTVTKTLTYCTISNSATKVVKGEPYNATITANDGYELKSVTVTMGGANVSVTNGVIDIASVTGNIDISAVAEEEEIKVVNLIETALATDLNSVYNTIGYKANTRCGSTDGAEKTGTKCTLVGLIPLGNNGDVFHIRGVDIVNWVSGRHSGYYSCWDENGNFIYVEGSALPNTPDSMIGTDANGDITITMNHSAWKIPSGMKYIRFQFGTVSGDFIMTRNQLIPK